MAWIRTSVSMISFGFTIFKFFVYLRESDILSSQLPLQGPRNLGLGLVGLGTFLLGMAIVEYLLYQRWLSREMKQKFPLSTALLAAVLISLIGILALINLLYNVVAKSAKDYLIMASPMPTLPTLCDSCRARQGRQGPRVGG